MSKADNNYVNTKVYHKQGGTGLAVDSDGHFDFFAEGSPTGAQMRTLLYTNQLNQIIAASAGRLSVLNLPSGGHVVISASVGCSNMSAWLTSCVAGAELFLVWRRNGMGDESVGSVYISMSGVSLVGLSAQDLSSISLHNSQGSSGYIRFRSFSDNEWTVVERVQSKVVERPSA